MLISYHNHNIICKICLFFSAGEKIDIITWDENPAILIQNALSPAKVISVIADADEKAAKVVVPDYQLSLAIGKEGQNARLAARLTGFKIDIKSETQARSPEISLITKMIMKTMSMMIIMSMMRKDITKIRMPQKKFLPKQKHQQKKRR